MNNIKKYRKERGISQKEVAEILNVRQNTVSQWENDKRTPNVKQAIKIAEILKITVENLYK